MAATTVNDFYLKYVRPDADEADADARVAERRRSSGASRRSPSRSARSGFSSVLDAGLAVLSLAAGPVLGAFLVGVLTPRVGSRAMIVGMLTGVVVLTWVWWTARDGVDVVRVHRRRR